MMPELDASQRWVLALPAVLNEVNDADHGYLGGFARPRGAADAASLLGTWDIHTPEAANARLATLLASDNTALLAWQLGRAAAVAGWAYVAYLFDARTAWKWMLAAAAKAQAAFTSWAAFGESYARGRDDWRGQRPLSADDKEVRAVIKRLLSAKDSPWVTVPWRTALAKVAVPLPRQRALIVGPRGFASITEALAAAEDGDRITVHGGVYRELLAFEKSVELHAQGEVVLEHAKGPLVTVDDTSVVLAGFTIRTKGRKAAPAIHASGGFLRLERCAITAIGFGIDLLDDDAEVYLDSSRVVSCGSVGVIVEGGVLVARDTVFGDNVSASLQIGGESRAHFLRARIEPSTGSGVQLHGEASATFRGCEVHGNAQGGIVVREDAALALEACKLRGNDAAQVWLGSTGTITIASVAIDGGAGYGIQVQSGTASVRGAIVRTTGLAGLAIGGGRPSIADSTFSDSAQSGVFVFGDAAPTLTSCRVERNGSGGLEVRDGANPEFRGCTFADNTGDGVLVQESGRGRFTRCVMTRSSDAGVRVLTRADPRFTRCQIERNAKEGIVVGQRGKGQFAHCDVHANGDAGLVIAEAGDPRVVRCHVHDNAADDVSVHDKGRGTLEDGAIGGGRGWALRAEGGSKPTLRRMQIRAGAKGEVSHDAKSKPVLAGCELGAGGAFVIGARPPLPGSLGRKLAVLDAALAIANPDASDAMNDGADDAALAKLAKLAKRDDLATFFRWHDGQATVASLGRDDNRTPMSIAEVIAAWKFMNKPSSEVLKPWSKTWLPLFTNGAGDYLCLELAGKHAGTLVEYWHADPDRKRAYPSLEAWADRVIAALARA